MLIWAANTALLAQPYGLSNRVANTTLRMPSTLPVFGYVTSNAFSGLSFSAPVAIVSAPGETNRLFVVEQPGRIVVITNLANPTRTVFLDLSGRVLYGGEQGLLGLAFHPGYATNRYFYVFYTLNTNAAVGDSTRHDRLSRFETSPANPHLALTNSEVVLINQRDEASNHNGGDLHFGPDGYLYVALGDEGGANDNWNNSQRIDKDFFAGLLRLDVDQRPGSLPPNAHPAGTTNYAVPPDNPFVGATSFNGSAVNPASVRTEFWAVGLRNPWRFSFDAATGRLYCGDVGQGAWEEINVITGGGNYGWAYREGAHAGPKTPPAGFTSIDPVLEYAHGSGTNQGNSVTGGVVYRGSRLPLLDGAYVFADYVSGNVWALRYDGTNASGWQRLIGNPNIAGFGLDPSNGDVLLADLNAGQVKRLLYTTVSGAPLPPTLAETGAFTNLAALEPHPGIVAYDVNVPFWSDGAVKSRWFSVPNSASRITFRYPSPPNYGPWTFPTGTVWIKHFELELTNGVPESRRRLETRFLVRDAGSTVYGVTYRWDPAQTNATLVPSEGLDEPFIISEGGLLRTQVWHYPSRDECLRCHTAAFGYAAGFNTAQLNRDHDYDGIVDNQLRALSYAGYFNPTPTNLHALPLLAHPTNEAFSVEARVRGYLMANCAQCHFPGGVAPGRFDARSYPPLSVANLVNGTLNNTLGDPANRLVVPGAISNSMLLTRMAVRGTWQMPPLASSVLDTQGIALLSRWITNDLVGYESFADWQVRFFGSTNAPAAAAAADPDGDRGLNTLEYLTGTNPTNALDAWSIGVERSGDTVEVVYPRLANRGFEVRWSPNLFSTSSWQFLNIPENRPFFAASHATARVPDALTNGPPRYYRVRVYEP